MKSLCIKTNNKNSINYILSELENLKIENTYYVLKDFKNFTNIIIHYTGENIDDFYSEISSVLSYLVLDNYEETIFKKILSQNYFYFDKFELETIISICFEILDDNLDFSIDDRFIILFNSFYNYIYYNKKLFLTGFINFRLKKYFLFLENIVDIAVNKYIIEREYIEFISLLKYYINSNKSTCNVVHLLYTSSGSCLFDEHNNLIDTSKIKLDSTYLSDISFSENDYILNALLTLLPQKIIIHIDEPYDDFINTLKLVFEKRIIFEKKLLGFGK